MDGTTNTMDGFNWIDGTKFVYDVSFMRISYAFIHKGNYCPTHKLLNASHVDHFQFQNNVRCINTLHYICQFDCAKGRLKLILVMWYSQGTKHSPIISHLSFLNLPS